MTTAVEGSRSRPRQFITSCAVLVLLSGCASATPPSVSSSPTTSSGSTAASGSSAEAAPQSSPARLLVVVSTGVATITWESPDQPGGSPVTGYTIVVDASPPVSLPATTTRYQVKGLKPGSAHAVKVAARSSGGSGPFSATTFLVPVASTPRASSTVKPKPTPSPSHSSSRSPTPTPKPTTKGYVAPTVTSFTAFGCTPIAGTSGYKHHWAAELSGGAGWFFTDGQKAPHAFLDEYDTMAPSYHVCTGVWVLVGNPSSPDTAKRVFVKLKHPYTSQC